MQVIRTIQHVSGETLTIQLPADFHATRVEIIVLPIEDEKPNQELPAGVDSAYAGFVRPKPHLTEEDRQLLAQRPNPLAGTVRTYIAPFEPAVPPDDWIDNP
ncbi:MAG: hypothetical protein ETSY1_15000 [Candidatus Entotheonella factor]|uniref:Uncharacterized protein n=2 Tax=Candidatus Entotheonella TaxID=93171 RepID=W4LMY4_ENTF1|nr:MAG: hypothetical protein ETSY1_15000 [Candidatus Entotheonella factor]